MAAMENFWTTESRLFEFEKIPAMFNHEECLKWSLLPQPTVCEPRVKQRKFFVIPEEE